MTEANQDELWLTFSFFDAKTCTIGPMDVQVSACDNLKANLIQAAGFQFNMEEIHVNSGIYRFQISYLNQELYATFGNAASAQRSLSKLINQEFKTVEALGFKAKIGKDRADTQEGEIRIPKPEPQLT